MPAQRKVSIKVRITGQDGKRRYCNPVLNKQGQPKAGVALVDGNQEQHPEAVFVLRYQSHDGSRVWESVGNDPQLAVTAKLRREHVLKSEQLGLVEPTARKTKPQPEAVDPNRKPIAAAAEEWLTKVRSIRSERTTYIYAKTVELFRASCPKQYMDEINREDVTAWILSLEAQGHAPRTRFNFAGFLRTFFRWAGHKDLIKGKGDMPRYTEKRVTSYNVDQVRAMLQVGNPEEQFLLEFLVGSGLREQEAMFACYEDVDFTLGELLVKVKPEFKFKIKDCEERGVPLPAPLLARLKARRDSRPGQRLIVPNTKGKPDGHLLLKIKRLHLRAGLNCGHCMNKKGKRCDRHPVCRRAELHKTRKSFSTLLSQGGVPIQNISAYLGHADIATTRSYLEAAGLSVEQRAKVDNAFALLHDA